MNRIARGHRLSGALALVLAVSMGCSPNSETKRPLEQDHDAVYSVRMARSLFKGGRVGQALATLEAAIAREPDNASLHNYYGVLCFQSGRLELAAEALQRALEVDPYLTDAHNNLGTVYLELGRIAEAEEQFRKALEDPAYPTPEKVYLNLGLLYGSQGRDKESVESLRKSEKVSAPGEPRSVNPASAR